MSLEVGDLIFVRGTSLVDRAIEWAEHGRYSHVAIYTGGGKVLEAQGFRRTGYNTLGAYSGRYDIGHVKNATYPKRVKALRFAFSKIGTRYAWRAFFVLALQLLFHWKIPYKQTFHEFICSFYVEDAWAAGGHSLTTVANPTPQDLAISPEITIEKLP